MDKPTKNTTSLFRGWSTLNKIIGTVFVSILGFILIGIPLSYALFWHQPKDQNATGSLATDVILKGDSELAGADKKLELTTAFEKRTLNNSLETFNQFSDDYSTDSDSYLAMAAYKQLHRSVTTKQKDLFMHILREITKAQFIKHSEIHYKPDLDTLAENIANQLQDSIVEFLQGDRDYMVSSEFRQYFNQMRNQDTTNFKFSG